MAAAKRKPAAVSNWCRGAGFKETCAAACNRPAQVTVNCYLMARSPSCGISVNGVSPVNLDDRHGHDAAFDLDNESDSTNTVAMKSGPRPSESVASGGWVFQLTNFSQVFFDAALDGFVEL